MHFGYFSGELFKILNPRHVVFYTDEHWHEMLFEEKPMCEIQLTTLSENFHSLDFKQLLLKSSQNAHRPFFL